MWACGVAAAARAAATAPGLSLFVLGALGGVAGVWEARESGVWRRFSAEPEGERMRTSGLLGAGGGGAAGAGAGAAGWGELGAGAEAVGSRIQAQSRRPVRAANLAGELLQAKFRLLTPFGVLHRACSAAAGACVRSTLAPCLLRVRFTLGSSRFSAGSRARGEAG